MGRVCRQPVRKLRQYRLGDRWGYGPNACKVQSAGDDRWDPVERHSPSVHRTQRAGGHGCDTMVWGRRGSISTAPTRMASTISRPLLPIGSLPRSHFFSSNHSTRMSMLRTAELLRAQSYWTVLQRGFGHFFGNCPVWGFGFTGDYCPALTDWRAQLDSPGALGMQHFQALFNSRHWQTLVPDTSQSVLMAGNGTFGDTDYASAACAADGSSIIAYLPSSRAITVNGTCLTGSTMIAWWYDPSTGVATQIGTFPTTTPQTFYSPDQWRLGSRSRQC